MSVTPYAPAVFHDAAPWLERLARIGYAAKGVLYLTAGALATSFALGNGGKAGVDQRGALARLLEAPLGRPLLAVIALGLLGYALWRLVDGIQGVEHPGTRGKDLAIRTGRVLSGVVHLGLAATAGSLALWRVDAARKGGEPTQHWTARALDFPGGRYVVLAAGLGIVAYGLWQLVKAVRAELGKRLDLSRLPAGTGRAVVGISRFGLAARGVVFGTVGLLLVRAGLDEDPRRAGGVGKSMQELAGLGKWPFLAIALGLAAYGIYELVNARYRRIRAR